MKNNKSQLDIFLLKRIEENREELRHNLDSTLQVEQACLEEIVKGIKHCKTNITQCNKVLDKASLSVMPVWTAKKEAFTDNLTYLEYVRTYTNGKYRDEAIYKAAICR